MKQGDKHYKSAGGLCNNKIKVLRVMKQGDKLCKSAGEL
jgi:hypothetical protein